MNKPCYQELHDVISMEDFDCLKWFEQESSILTPRLEEAGYSQIWWHMGEADSFSPLTRYCTAVAPNGDFVNLIYG